MSTDRTGAPGPDFLCIGMGKAGTGWLFDQLQHHPAFWMPPVKELHYLDRDFPDNRKVRQQTNKDPRRWDKRRTKRGRRRLEERDLEFLRELQDSAGKQMSLDFYAAMFRFKGDQLSGDITPSYCSLPNFLIRDLVKSFPELKIVLLLRDPVARAWSFFSMKNRSEQIDGAVLRDAAQFRETLEQSKVYSRGAPAHIAKKWARRVPSAQFRIFFFDDIVADSSSTSGEILRFLGVEPGPGFAKPAHNRKADKPKVEMSDDIKEVLVSYFAEELREAAKVFGGHAAQWAAKYGVDC
jgi:hypothetical protein